MNASRWSASCATKRRYGQPDLLNHDPLEPQGGHGARRSRYCALPRAILPCPHPTLPRTPGLSHVAHGFYLSPLTGRGRASQRVRPLAGPMTGSASEGEGAWPPRLRPAATPPHPDPLHSPSKTGVNALMASGEREKSRRAKCDSPAHAGDGRVGAGSDSDGKGAGEAAQISRRVTAPLPRKIAKSRKIHIRYRYRPLRAPASIEIRAWDAIGRPRPDRHSPSAYRGMGIGRLNPALG